MMTLEGTLGGPDIVEAVQNCKHNDLVMKALDENPYVIALVSNKSCEDAIDSLHKGPENIRTLCTYSSIDKHKDLGIGGLTCKFTTTELYVFNYAVLLNLKGNPVKI